MDRILIKLLKMDSRLRGNDREAASVWLMATATALSLDTFIAEYLYR